MNSLPIGDYALLSDCHSAALVSRAGSVDWLCFPRFGNFPQAFSHIGLINAAWAITQAKERVARRVPVAAVPDEAAGHRS
jgi:GH15 family glucan-1,4-alpha-glucosidase